MHQKILTFILYINNSTNNLIELLNKLSSLDKNKVDVILQIDVNNESLNNQIDSLVFTNKNFIILKNSNHLGVSLSYNLSLNIVESKYLMFVNSNIDLNINNFERIYNLLENTNYDIISFTSNHDYIYNYSSSTYNKITSDLILSAHNDSVFNKIFRSEFLVQNEILFTENKWYPDYFILQCLLFFNEWHHVNEQLIINNEFNTFKFNIYDLLFQINAMKKLLNKENNLLTAFHNEFEYWIIYIIRYSFLLQIIQKYGINNSKKNTKEIKKNKIVFKYVKQNISKTTSLHASNYKKNPYYIDAIKIFSSLAKKNY